MAGKILELDGYRITELGELRPDGGIDHYAEKLPSTAPIGLQCKKYYRYNITPREIREFLGSLVIGGYKQGIYITLKGFTKEALKIAADNNIDTWDAERLCQVISENEDRLSDSLKKLLNSTYEYCSRCESRMTLKKARRGVTAGSYFWACTDYSCRYTKDFE